MRPEHVKLYGKGKPRLAARVEIVENLGDASIVHFVTAEGTKLVAKLPPTETPQPGDLRSLFWTDSQILRFDVTGRRLR